MNESEYPGEPRLADNSPADTETAAVIDFTKTEGAIRHALHGCNTTQSLSDRNFTDFRNELRAMNFHAARTHDWSLWNSGTRLIDTHFIFPLMKLDPADPTNYYFKQTDEIIRMTREECGMRVFYRLGTSIEHTGWKPEEHFNTIMPDDFEKYAEVLAAIVRHYRSGWGGGFHFKDMEYWEIWNEPDIPGSRMWSGSLEEFTKFYVTVLKRLKSEFPDIKVGGPALTNLDEAYFTALLTACREAGTAPDFISWHYYTCDADDLIGQPARARAMLDNLGFRNVETCIDEWHYLVTWHGFWKVKGVDLYRMVTEGRSGINGIDGGVFNLAVLSGWQSTPLDRAFYYGSTVDGTWGFRDGNRKFNKNLYSMKMYGTVMKYAVRVSAERRFPNIYPLGALSADGTKGCLLVADLRGERMTVELTVHGLENAKNLSAVILDDAHDLVPVPVIRNGSRLTLVKNDCSSSAFLIQFDL